jgi:hypothetical protein
MVRELITSGFHFYRLSHIEAVCRQRAFTGFKDSKLQVISG